MVFMRTLDKLSLTIVIFSFLFAEFAISQEPANVFTKEYFGMHIHHADDVTPRQGKEIGSWRLHDNRVHWVQIEPYKGQWDFKKLDKLVSISQTTQSDLLMQLGITPLWASARPEDKSPYWNASSSEPKYIGDWENYVKTLGTRYKNKIIYYEIWNEPNIKQFYSGDINNLVKLTCSAKKVLNDISPNIKIVGPSVTSVRPQDFAYLDDFLKQGGKDCIDIVSYHFYVADSTPEELYKAEIKVIEIMQANGVGNKPLWNTEAGWKIENEFGTGTKDKSFDSPYWKLINSRLAASYVLRSLVISRFAGIERYYWYSWDHEVMGLMEPTTKLPKLAGRVYLEFANKMIGGSITSCTITNELWQCNLKDAKGKKLLMLWTADNKQKSVDVSKLGGQKLWRPVDEATLDLVSVKNLVITNEPVFIYQ
jgi:hypothetical protein